MLEQLANEPTVLGNVSGSNLDHVDEVEAVHSVPVDQMAACTATQLCAWEAMAARMDHAEATCCAVELVLDAVCWRCWQVLLCFLMDIARLCYIIQFDLR